MAKLNETEPPIGWEPSPEFSLRVSKAIEKISHLQKQTQSAMIKLTPVDETWKVLIIEKEHEKTIIEMSLDATGDVIRLLTLPMRNSKPIWLDSKSFVEWNCFNDIDYGTLEVLRPFIETSAPKTSRKPIPARISYLVPLMEEKTMEIILYHDNDSCPVVQKKGENHDACWGLRPKDSDDVWIGRLFSHPLNAKEIYGLLSSGQIFEKGRKHSIDLYYAPQRDDSGFCVFNEASWIRSLLRKNGINLKPLPPGTFLRIKDQKWAVEIITRENRVIWSANSDVTGFLFDNRTFEFTLNPQSDFETAKADFMEKITQKIPLERIADPKSLEDRIRSLLENYGYGEDGPECQLDVSVNERTLKIILKQVGGGKSINLNEDEIKVDDITSKSGFLEGLSEKLSSGEYNITNQNMFLQKLGSLVDDMKSSDMPTDEIKEETVERKDDSKESLDRGYENELLEVIEEYRKEADTDLRARARLGESLTKLSIFKFEQGNIADALEIIDESILVLSASKENHFAIKRQHAEALITKCEILLPTTEGGDGKRSIGTLLTEAYKLLVELSTTDKITNQDKEKADRITRISRALDLE